MRKVLESGWITTGPGAAEFESEFGAYVGASHSVAVNSCTAALHLGLEAMGVTEGDEVITTPYTFASSSEVIHYLKAKPVFVDVERTTLNLDPELVEAAVSSRTKVILPVHMAGHPAKLDHLYRIAADHGLSVLEDCAHALPAYSGGRRIGADLDRAAYAGMGGHATCFSFYATKTLTTGEGGMLCTDDAAIAERARIMALHGMSRDAWKRYTEAGDWQYEVVAPGYKYNLGDIAAALGLVQLSKLERMWERRRELAGLYTAAFADRAEVELPVEESGCVHSWHLYPLRLNLDRLTIDRARFVDEMKSRGVGTSVHFIPLHTHPYYREEYGYAPMDFPVAYQEFTREVSLPIYSAMGDEEVDAVIKAALEILTRYSVG